MDDLSRNISLLCPVCGNDQFEHLGEQSEELQEPLFDVRFRCSDCGSIFTKEALLRENSEKINIAVEEIKADVIKEIEKELKNSLKGFKF